MKNSLIRQALLLCALFTNLPSLAGADDLFVYYPVALPVKDRQDALKKDLGDSNLRNVVVFGKFRDFFDQVKSSTPEIVIAPAGFQKIGVKYKPVLKLHNGATDYRYVLLALKEKVGNPADLRIGLVEETDRDLLHSFLQSTIGSNVQNFKSVPKPEDLFPALVLNTVDAILLSSYNYELLKKQFSTKVYKIFESKPLEAPRVYVLVDKNANLSDPLLKLSPATLSGLGFSGIEKL